MSSRTAIESSSSTSIVSTEPAQRGRGRGRGGRGRGRGRGRPLTAASQSSDIDNSHNNQQRQRPTHFLSLPLGHHPELRERVTTFANALLNQEPKIPGLDERILISPRRLHITLGVMTLADSSGTTNSKSPNIDFNSSNPNQRADTQAPATVKTVQAAIQLLQDLHPKILEKMSGHDLRVGLNLVDIMRPERGDLTKAHVMWTGPSYESEHARRLKHVCEFVHGEFKKAGFVDDRRPLKLHCTVINTSHRKGRRQPFSYADVIASDAFRSIERQSLLATGVEASGGDAEGSQVARGKKPIAVDLGEWTIDELQICKMGSWGAEGEYVAVGRIPLR